MRAIIVVLLVAGCCASEALGQRLIERGQVTNPLWDQRDPVPEGAWRGLHMLGGWFAFGPYLAGDDDHAWHHEIGGFLELVRTPRTSLFVTTQIEFIADPHNEINFNPRAIFWEEGLVLTRRLSGFDLQVGYYHRCKHDIDNLELGTERSLIYGSLRGRAIVPLSEARPHDAYAAVSADLYTHTWEGREPPAFEGFGTDWRRLLGTADATVHVRRPLAGPGVGVYATAFGGLNVYGANSGFFDRFAELRRVYPHGGVAAGLSLRGRATLRLGIEYEYLPDTGIPVAPRDAHLVRLVVRVTSPFAVQ